MEPEHISTKLLLHLVEVFPQQVFSVEIKESWELVDLDPRFQPRKVDSINGLFDQGKVVPNEAG